MKLFYQPEQAVLGDVIPFYDDGKFKPFYLKNTRGKDTPSNITGWTMLTTEDHLHFTEHPTYISGGTGSVIKVNDTYHLFYCTFARNPKRGYIRHAVSPDLDQWTTLEDEILPADGEIYRMEEWRDPFVFWNEEEGKWWMLIAANAVGKTNRSSCVGLCVSDDLHHWEYRQPFYKPMECGGACECPDLFKIGEWYYLVFSYYCDRFQTVYRMSKSLNGPWITPVPDDSFDTRAYYAAKTGTDGVHRYVYGWNPTKVIPKRNMNPANQVSKDCNSWDWGGTLEVHQVLQNSDGTLYVAPEPHVYEALKNAQEIMIEDVLGTNTIQGNNVTVGAEEGFGGVLLNQVPDLCKFEADVEFSKDVRRFGVAVQVDENYDRGYYIYLEPSRNRMEYASGIRMYGDGGKMFPYAVELERPVKLEADQTYHLTVFVQEDLLLVYFNNQVALSGRMYDYTGRRFGLFSFDGDTKFTNVSLYTE